MDEILRSLIAQAEAGDVEAMCMVGDCYNKGMHTEPDDKLSHKYYKMAADSGHVRASIMTGIDYQSGIGVRQDYAAAEVYLEFAAKQGHPFAQYLLGLQFLSGNAGLFGREKKAFSLFEKAAMQGHAGAQVQLGDCYFLGKGTKESVENSLFWLCCAYLHGDSDPQASNDALDRLNKLISLGMPGGKPRVEKKLQEVQQQYPSYCK